MKKFLIRLAIFTGVCLFITIFIPANTYSRFNNIEDDCLNRGAWIYNRMIVNERNIEIAFLGSSHTITGVNDSLISQLSQTDSRNVVNLGYCRLGENLNYSILRELFLHKQVGSIVYEVRDFPATRSHPMYPLLAGTKEVISSPLHKSWAADLFKHLSHKIKLLGLRSYQSKTSRFNRFKDFGINVNVDTLNISDISMLKNERRWKVNPFSDTYFKRIQKMCNQHGVSLKFLYLPKYNSKLPNTGYLNYYEQFGSALIPDETLFTNHHYWHDGEHLNRSGSDKLSRWLSTQFY